MKTRSDIEQAISAVLQAKTNDFVELARTAGLDPANAFKYTDLSGCDFSGCDLDGFDFSGANLTGASFRGASVSNTRFDGAILTDVVGLPDSNEQAADASLAVPSVFNM